MNNLLSPISDLPFHSFVIPSRFHPAYSLLGRLIKRRVLDSRRAESSYILVATLMGLVLVLAQILAWTFLQPHSSIGMPVFIFVQAAAAAAFGLSCLVGRQPAIQVMVAEDAVAIHSAERVVQIPVDLIERLTTIDARLYYLHYRRYQRTWDFVNRCPPTVFLIEHRDRPIMLGLAPADQPSFEAALARASAKHQVV